MGKLTLIFSYRESHCHPLEDCCHIRTWQHQLRSAWLSPLVLQPHRSPETTVSAAPGLGCNSALIRSPPLSPQACLQPDPLAVQTHDLSFPNREAESQVRCVTITATKLRPSRRLLHIKPALRVPWMNCTTCIIRLEDSINHSLHGKLSYRLFFILTFHWQRYEVSHYNDLKLTFCRNSMCCCIIPSYYIINKTYLVWWFVGHKTRRNYA